MPAVDASNKACYPFQHRESDRKNGDPPSYCEADYGPREQFRYLSVAVPLLGADFFAVQGLQITPMSPKEGGGSVEEAFKVSRFTGCCCPFVPAASETSRYGFRGFDVMTNHRRRIQACMRADSWFPVQHLLITMLW